MVLSFGSVLKGHIDHNSGPLLYLRLNGIPHRIPGVLRLESVDCRNPRRFIRLVLQLRHVEGLKV